MRGAFFTGLLAGGAVVTLLVVVRPPKMFSRPPHVRTNYRGTSVAGTLGIVLLVPLVVGSVIAWAAAGARVRVVVATAGAGTVLGLVGLVDDLYGDRRAGGLLGHARALAHGRVTTGSLKAFSGALVGFGVAWTVGWRGVWTIIAGAVVAMAANLANLLDVRPGRCVKVWLVSFAALAIVSGMTDSVLTTAALAGGAGAFLPADLRERGMLGDAGAGLLGASLGAGAVATVGRTALVTLAATLALLTAASEAVSFTRVIERVGPLRWADKLGRPG